MLDSRCRAVARSTMADPAYDTGRAVPEALRVDKSCIDHVLAIRRGARLWPGGTP